MQISTQEAILDFVTDGNTTPRVRIDHRGHVDIGPNPPTNQLDVEGGATIGVTTGTAAPTNGLLVGGQTQLQAGKPQHAVTTTTYTLALTDAGKLVTLNNSGSITLTVPANATVAFALGAEIQLLQLGAGVVTVSPAMGVTVDSLNSYVKFAGQFGAATLTLIGADTWLLRGDLVTS